MLAAAVGLTINVNIEKEQVLFITIKDKHDYEVSVQALQIAEALTNR